MSDQYWEAIWEDWQKTALFSIPASCTIYGHSHGFCDSQEQYDEITVMMIRDFKKQWRKNLHECPCCGERTIIFKNAGEQCDVCGWYDDEFAVDYPDECEDGDMNPVSFNEAKRIWDSTHEPIAEITEIPKGTAPPAEDVLWEAGCLEKVLREARYLTEDEIQEILRDHEDE